MIIKTKGITLTLVLALIINMLCLPCVSALADASYSADYEPGNPNAIFATFTENSATKAAIHLSWVNPKADTLKEIRIYGDSSYGENKFDTLITTISDPTPGAVSEYDVKSIGGSDLNQNTYYTYRIVYVFEDRQTEVLVSSRARTAYMARTLRETSSGVRSKVTIDGSMDNMPGMTQQVVNDADGGYLKLSANVDASNTAYRYLKFYIGAGVLTGSTKYNVKITYKSDSDLNLGVFDFKKNTEWTEIEKEVTTVADGRVVLSADWVNSFYNLCIKSVEVFNVSDGSLADSYDCSIYNIKPQPVSGVAASVSGNDVDFAIASSPSWWWNNGNDGVAHTVTYYNIYEVINGEKFLRANLARNAMSITNIPVTLHNVSVGTHTYEVTCSTEAGLESEPVEKIVEIADVHELSNLSATPYRVSSYAVGMNVSWTNPIADTLNKVMLYRENANGDTLISEYSNPVPGETMTYKDANLETNKNYSYKVVCSFTDNADVEGAMNGYLDLDVKEFVPSYHPKNMAAVQYGTGSGKVGITLSWINPCVMEISGITVSRMEESGEVFLTDSLDLTPEKVVEYSDLDLDATNYTYKIKFDYPDHLSSVYYLSAAASDAEFRKLIRGVNVAGIYSKTKIVPGITNKVVKDGDNRYMKLTVNVPEGDTERGAYFAISSKTVLEAGKTYTFKMRVKTEESANITLKCGDMSNTIGTERVAADGNWHEISATFSAPYKTYNLMAVFDGTVTGLYIDDIEISDANGELDHFNFDEYDRIPAPPGTLDFAVSKNSATATVSISKDWWWDDTGFDKLARTMVYYNIYEKTENGPVLRAKLCRPVIGVTSMSAVIDNLMFSNEYNFFATTEDNYGILESEEIETKFRTENEPDGIQISDFSVRSSEGTAEGVVTPGEYTVNVDIGNYSENSFKAQLIVAVYKANKLVKLCGTDITDIASNKGNKPTTRLKISGIDISGLTGDDCTMDVMLWSGVDTMKILKGAQTFKIINN